MEESKQMNCPNCGAETNEAICPVCGANVGVGMNNPYQQTGMGAGMNNPYQQTGMGADMNNGYQQTGMGAGMNNAYQQPDMNGGYQQLNMGNNMNMGMDYQQPYMPASTPEPKKSKGGLIAAIVAAVIVIAAVAAVLAFVVFGENGEKKSKQVVDTYMTGLAEADSDKIASVVDPKCTSEDELQQVADAFEMLKSMGIEYTLDYKIVSVEEASTSEIKSMCEGIYDDESVAADIKSAYICDVEYTMNMTYLGESESEEDSFSLICYKKDGTWYVGGTMSE
jgi:hypothetical protein